MPRKQAYPDPQSWSFMVIYWHENQASITFHSDLDLSEGNQEIINSLNLVTLNQFLNMRGFNLKSFTLDDVPHPPEPQKRPPSQEEREEPVEAFVEAEIKALEEMVHGRPKKDDDARHEKDDTHEEGENPINSPTGKYLFPAPSDNGTIVLGFFHVEQSKTTYSMSTARSMNGSGGSSYGDEEVDHTRQLVDLINRNLDTLRQGKVPVVAAAPNWLSGSTGCVTHCPSIPPIPISAGSSCTPSAGLWPITLPELDDTMQGLTGDGVTVFVLDTMPEPDEIINAAASAGNNNLLLQTIVNQYVGGQTPPVKLQHLDLGKRLDDSTSSEQPESGEDLYGRSFVYPSQDHGLFITGIVRDLAPRATIEYIRALNDYGVGDNSGLVDELSYIQTRMGKNGDLHDKPVVINLSLGAIPSREELAELWFNADDSYQTEEFVRTLEDIELLQLGLHLVIQSLAELGAVIVASAGNDSNIPQWNSWAADPASRKGPRYPAAYPEVISVGAVDKHGRAAQYSNYPQLPPYHNGIATYGGGIPTPVPPVGPSGQVPPGDHGPDPRIMTTAIGVDGVVGVYTAPFYPALSRDDPPPQSYNASAQSYDWAYWSGTSFATPIISAVAARVLQLKSPAWPPQQRAAAVQKAITTPAGESALLTGGSPLPLQTDFGFGVRMLKACQCEEAQQDNIASVTEGVKQEV